MGVRRILSADWIGSASAEEAVRDMLTDRMTDAGSQRRFSFEDFRAL